MTLKQLSDLTGLPPMEENAGRGRGQPGFLELAGAGDLPMAVFKEDIHEEIYSEPGSVPGAISEVVRSVIEQAVNDRASDIHIEPREKEVRLRYRIDGILYEITTFPLSLKNPVVSRIKILAGMDIAEKRIPQDGRFQQKVNDQEIDIRVSSFPTVYGEKIVLRLLYRNSSLKGLEDLGFSPEALDNIKTLLDSPQGMSLVTGPTGCGKTTTMYALLAEINSTEKNIITLEDPVEYVIEGINQTSVNPRAGLSFPVGLRSILRQDPDVIMVGEIRDLETAQIAIRAANTGHLLISTLHTNDAPSALTRLVDMGIEPYLVASSVNGILSQRLVRRICPDCIREYQLPEYAAQRKFLSIDERQPFICFMGKGCDTCGNTGYFGRAAVGEVLFVTEPIRKMLLCKESATAMMKYLIREEGFKTIRENGIAKIKEGITTIQEIQRCL